MSVPNISSNNFFSPTEQKLLLGIAILMCCLFFANFGSKIIENHNRKAELKQIENETGQKIEFSGCYPCVTPIFEHIIFLQLIAFPLIFLFLTKRRIGYFISSTFLASYIFFGYLNWIGWSYYIRTSVDDAHFVDASFYNYLFINSTFLDLIVFLILAILLVLQISILLRFVIEKFQAKIS